MLTTLLWPEMDEPRAKKNLRLALSTLKKHVAPYVEATSNTVAFNRQVPYWLDVERFQRSVEDALAAQDLQALQRAFALYQGEFLRGFQLRQAAPFEEWQIQQREQLHLRALRTL